MKALRAMRRGIIYLVLVTGAAVFSFPFLWMATTSVKVDRELQTEQLRLLPMTPSPKQRSPYVEMREFEGLEGPALGELLSALEEMVDESGFEIPATVNRELARGQIARGLYDRLRRRLPKQIWQGRRQKPDGTWGEEGDVVPAVTAAAREQVHRRAVAEVFDRVHRRLLVGEIRLRTYDREETVLGTGEPVSRRLENRSPDVARIGDVVEQGRSYATVQYDFGAADRFVLAETFSVDERIDLSRLHRIQMVLRPDDTWHELWLTVETAGGTLRAARAFPLANFDSVAAAWQPAGPDDQSTKIRTWIPLEPAEQADAGDLADDQVRLNFEFRKVSQAGAWWNKLRFNYDKVFDHIPFWRYLRVSLFLVIANIVLTLLVSSLVAYAFARLNWPGREFCFVLLLATMMIPFQVIMIPQFLIWKHLGAYNTLVPLWLGPAVGSAFYIFLMRQFIRGIPRDLEDAARIDGCGFLRIYWYIILPLIKPSLAAIAIFVFMGTWNNFMGPLIYVADQRLYPLAFGLYAFSVQVANNPALTMAGSLLMTVPVIVIFFFAQKYFIQGVTLTGMKA